MQISRTSKKRKSVVHLANQLYIQTTQTGCTSKKHKAGVHPKNANQLYIKKTQIGCTNQTQISCANQLYIRGPGALFAISCAKRTHFENTLVQDNTVLVLTLRANLLAELAGRL